MPERDRPLVDRHVPNNGVGWLVNDQCGKISSFTEVMLDKHGLRLATSGPGRIVISALFKNVPGVMAELADGAAARERQQFSRCRCLC